MPEELLIDEWTAQFLSDRSYYILTAFAFPPALLIGYFVIWLGHEFFVNN